MSDVEHLIMCFWAIEFAFLCIDCPLSFVHFILCCSSFLLFIGILLFIYLFIFTLQYCIGFAIHQHASATGVHVFPILNPLPPPSRGVIPLGHPSAPAPHPSGSSQCTSPKLPVSCIEPGLAIHFLYDIIHVLMPFSQIIPPPPFPQSPKDCSIHLCVFCCLTYRVVVTIFLNSIYMCWYTVLVVFFLAYFTLHNRLQFHPPH